MFSPAANWQFGLQGDLTPQAASHPFQELLAGFLPLSQQDLAKKISRDRTTVTKWKRGELWATLGQQRKVVKAVRDRLVAITHQVDQVEKMIEALGAVETAHDVHTRKLDQKSLDKLTAANDQVRALL